MSELICCLGSHPLLSRAELAALYSHLSLTELGSDCALLTGEELPEPQAILARAGGVVKVLSLKRRLSLSTTDTELLEAVVQELQALGEPFEFALAEHGRDHKPRLEAAAVKTQLQTQGVRVRYHSGSRTGLSAALLLHHPKVKELQLIQTDREVILAQTAAVQNIDEWTRRDRSRPYADRKKGMLPLKIARIMVNLAAQPLGSRIYDPFCGAGSILSEALTLGYTAVGSDQDEHAVTGTQANLDWLKHTYNLTVESQVFTAEVTRVSTAQLSGKVDAIVTEPFLGKPRPVRSQLPGIITGLNKLYWSAFRTWTQLLKPGGSVVVIFPRFDQPNAHHPWQHLIDKLSSIGYTMTSEPLEYARPDAVVKREVYQFRYQGS